LLSRFRTLPDSFVKVIPTLSESYPMIIRDESERGVPECDHRLAANFLQAILQV
jgi:hypothetical protein